MVSGSYFCDLMIFFRVMAAFYFMRLCLSGEHKFIYYMKKLVAYPLQDIALNPSFHWLFVISLAIGRLSYLHFISERCP